MSYRRARRGAAVLALCLGVLPTGGCSAVDGPVRRPASAASVRPASAAVEPPVVMFLGDSYTVGERGTQPENAYSAAVARLLGWQVIVGGRGGTGFVANGGRQPFGVMFESQLGWRPPPDLLIVSGGHNDWVHPAPRVGAAARELLARARQRWPKTRLALIGPIWGNEAPPPNAVAVRDALRGVAGELGVPFVDPIGEQWITGNRATGTGNATGFIRSDGVHPTVEGHRYLAARLAEDLRRLGLAHPVRNR
ncbi:SGNH/GDSL hydrolase family protein [Actinomadura hibisca]|uniref:SGNH/GDSL hydrolase family protein n=1 Tax=Actinomadura hibisca TaxID=68565 RepID=UPI00082A8439|nr:SGNH/GDSL hydrolase family protein [Actinomadura hibisca]